MVGICRCDSTKPGHLQDCSQPCCYFAGQEESWAHHPSLDPQVLGPGHHPPAKPKLKAHPTNRLLNDSELISLLTQVPNKS